MDMVISCLNRFCMASGQKVNQAKANVFFSWNVKHDLRRRILSKYGFALIIDLGMYLGIPILHKRIMEKCFWVYS